MKLKVLPPTLRKNHHYLILDVKSEVEISIEELKKVSKIMKLFLIIRQS